MLFRRHLYLYLLQLGLKELTHLLLCHLQEIQIILAFWQLNNSSSQWRRAEHLILFWGGNVISLCPLQPKELKLILYHSKQQSKTHLFQFFHLYHQYLKIYFTKLFPYMKCDPGQQHNVLVL